MISLFLGERHFFHGGIVRKELSMERSILRFPHPQFELEQLYATTIQPDLQGQGHRQGTIL